MVKVLRNLVSKKKEKEKEKPLEEWDVLDYLSKDARHLRKMKCKIIDKLSRDAREVIYTAARDGMPIFLYDLLSRVRPKEMQNIYVNEVSWRMIP